MDIRHIARAGLVVMAAVLLFTFAFAALAFAQEAAPAAPADAAKAAEAKPAAEGEAKAAEGEVKAEAAEGEKAAEGEAKEEEIPHKVGNPTPAQLQDLRYAWASIPGFDLLLVAILGLVATVGVIGFGVFKQMKV